MRRTPKEIIDHHATALAEGDVDAITDGVDTFVIRDGLIQLQTARFTVRPKPERSDA